eukprot:3741366-Pleurochrysis_carterae.AAC.1
MAVLRFGPRGVWSPRGEAVSDAIREAATSRDVARAFGAGCASKMVCAYMSAIVSDSRSTWGAPAPSAGGVASACCMP